MTEKQLIAKIKELRQIKPRTDWVILTKSQILKEAPAAGDRVSPNLNEIIAGIRIIFNHKLVFASLTLILVIIGAFGFAQNNVPGDLLFPLKKISEQGKAFFVSNDEKAGVQLQTTNRRLEELTKIAETNQPQKLAPAIKEFQATVSQAAENIKNISESPKVNREIVLQAKKLQENKEKIEALGVIIGDTEELDNALSQLVEREIKDLEESNLTEEQSKILEEAKKDFEVNNYSQALEKILVLSSQ